MGTKARVVCALSGVLTLVACTSSPTVSVESSSPGAAPPAVETSVSSLGTPAATSTLPPSSSVSVSLPTSFSPGATADQPFTSSSPNSTAEAPTSAIVSSSPSDEPPPPIGSTQTVTLEDQVLKVTTYELQNVPKGEYSTLDPGQQNTALDVEVCPSYASTAQSEGRWLLIDSTNGRYEPELTGEQLSPEYPYSAVDLQAGECVRGWIMFQTLIERPVTTVRYSTSNGFTLRWSIL